MKKIGILVLFLAFGAISYAQSLRDKFFLGGSLGFAFTSEKYEESSPSVNPDTYRYFQVNPSFGFYLSDKWALGLMARVQSSTRKNTESYVYFVQGIYTQGQFIEIQKDRSFRVAPFIRYTKFITEKFAFNLDFCDSMLYWKKLLHN